MAGSDNPQGSPEPVTAPAPGPRIVIAFAGEEAAECRVDLGDVSTAQLYGAAWFLDQLAREVRASAVMSQAGRGLVVARPGLQVVPGRNGRPPA